MWLFDFVPPIVVHLMLMLGIVALLVSTFLKAIPTVSAYEVGIHILGIILTMLGVWAEGASAEAEHWKEKLANANEIIAKLEENSKKVNTKVVTQVLTQKETIREKGDTVTQYVDREVTKYDHICPVPAPEIKALNAAALGLTVEELPK